MPPEPSTKRAIAFVDGQNLFYAAKYAFGYHFPNYDIPALPDTVCRAAGWTLVGVHFYTGIPSAQDDPFWNHFWNAKLAVMGTRGVTTFSRHLRYRNQTVALPDGTSTTVLVGQEKGIDVRIVRQVHRPHRLPQGLPTLITARDLEAGHTRPLKSTVCWDDGESFEDKMSRPTKRLREQQAEAAHLDAEIAKNLKELGFGE